MGFALVPHTHTKSQKKKGRKRKKENGISQTITKIIKSL